VTTGLLTHILTVPKNTDYTEPKWFLDYFYPPTLKTCNVSMAGPALIFSYGYWAMETVKSKFSLNRKTPQSEPFRINSLYSFDFLTDIPPSLTALKALSKFSMLYFFTT
jgi:hypothetical protein